MLEIRSVKGGGIGGSRRFCFKERRAKRESDRIRLPLGAQIRHEIARFDIETVGELGDEVHARIPLPGFDLLDVLVRHPATASQLRLREVLGLAQFGELLRDRVIVGLFLGRWHARNITWSAMV